MDLRGEGDALRVVARRRADDAAAFLLFGHQRELVERSADLVRADALKHFGLQPDVEPAAFAQLPRRQERRVLDVRRDARAHFFEVATA